MNPEADTFQNPAQDILKVWMEVYEREFRRFLNMPQLGLTRFYQERTGEVLDKTNLFQAKVAEFLSLLFLPLEKSFKAMPERIEELTKCGKSCGTKDYYQIWIKTLEDYYVTLLKSPEFVRVMNGILEALEELTTSRAEFQRAFLQAFSIPSYADLDDLSKEFYQLKKRVKELSREMDHLARINRESGIPGWTENSDHQNE
jgi:class III poly(R)-hydroxyalkanoic acid synthase PhaE subunit